jgi:hypothetical protein
MTEDSKAVISAFPKEQALNGANLAYSGYHWVASNKTAVNHSDVVL